MKNIKEIVKEFENKVASGEIFDCDGNNITEQFYSFLSSSLTSLLEWLKESLPKHYEPNDIDDETTTGTRNYWIGLSLGELRYKDKVIKLIDSLK